MSTPATRPPASNTTALAIKALQEHITQTAQQAAEPRPLLAHDAVLTALLAQIEPIARLPVA